MHNIRGRTAASLNFIAQILSFHDMHPTEQGTGVEVISPAVIADERTIARPSGFALGAGVNRIEPPNLNVSCECLHKQDRP
jgi:hypothetical protein